MTKEVQEQLISDHFLFKEGDRFLQAANASRYWPTGRGIFHNTEKTFLVWVGEEDHLRIISMQQGGHVGQVSSDWWRVELQTKIHTNDRFVIMENLPTRAFSWLKAATTAFTFKTLLRHYAKRALTPR